MSMADFNTQVINEFRENDGQVGGMFESMPLLLLHHTGAKSGADRVSPLAYLEDGGRYAIFASKGGAPEHPSWYHNVLAHPDARIEIGGETIEVVASEAQGEERDRIYNAQAARASQFGDYEKNTTRKIPVVLLTPKG
ncbi:MAG TPA: nitroreductase family deazaflavin-dependent oxidoreductase [Solirubrobacteraceae bacterium]|jgi:deazaflavin-dependent oxidoreductase (nitroreductase family)|nr:nitroreductase family deazaflavin-dependent oxidoreductase [Solirubrobacteraceae bacterium]